MHIPELKIRINNTLNDGLTERYENCISIRINPALVYKFNIKYNLRIYII